MKNFTAEETLKVDNVAFNGNNMSTDLNNEEEKEPVFHYGIPQFEWAKEDEWLYRHNLQEAIDQLLRQYEKKGVMVKSIELILTPHRNTKGKPYTRINFY